MNHDNIDKIAKIDNTFILNAQYRMTAKEQKSIVLSYFTPEPQRRKRFQCHHCADKTH